MYKSKLSNTYNRSIVLSLLSVIIFSFFISSNINAEHKTTLFENKLQQAEIYYKKGIIYFNKKDFPASISFFRKALDFSPENVAIWNHLGMAYFNLNQFSKALQTFKKAAVIDKKDTEIQYNIALVNFKIGKLDAALSVLKKLIQSPSGYIEKQLSLMGMVYSQKGDDKSALKAYKKAIEIDNQDAKLYYLIGNLYYKEGNIKIAARFYISALKLNKNLVNAQYNLANCFFKLGNFDQAANYYESALKQVLHALDKGKEVSKKHTKAFYNLGKIYEKQKLFKKALNAYSNALKINPDFAQAVFKKSIVWEHLGKNKKALKLMEKSFKMSSNCTFIGKNLFLLTFKLNYLDKCLNYYSFLNDKYPKFLTPSILVKTGIVYYRKKNYQKAAHFFSIVLNKDAKNIKALEGQALTALKMDNYDTAVKNYTAIINILKRKKEKPLPSYLWNLSYSLQKKDLPKEALQFTLDLIKYYPYGKFFYQAAILQARVNNKQAALKLFKSALKVKWIKGEVLASQTPPISFYRKYAQTCLSERKTKTALKIFKLGLKKFPNSNSLLIDFGNFLLSENKFNQAANIYNKVIKTEPKNCAAKLNLKIAQLLSSQKTIFSKTTGSISEPFLSNSKFWFERGNFFASVGYYQEAIKSYSKSINLSDNNKLVKWNKLLCLIKSKEWEQALAMLETFSEAPVSQNDFNNAMLLVLDSLANQKIQNEKIEEAELIYKKAVKISPSSSLFLNNLGYVLYHLEKYKEAARYFQRAFHLKSKNAIIGFNNSIALVVNKKHDEALSFMLFHPELKKFPEYYVNLGFLLLSHNAMEPDAILRAWEQALKKIHTSNNVVLKKYNELRNFYYGGQKQ